MRHYCVRVYRVLSENDWNQTKKKTKCNAELWKSWHMVIDFITLVFLAPIICCCSLRLLFCYSNQALFSIYFSCSNVFVPRVWYFIVLKIQQICILNIFALSRVGSVRVIVYILDFICSTVPHFLDEFTCFERNLCIQNGKFIHIHMIFFFSSVFKWFESFFFSNICIQRVWWI